MKMREYENVFIGNNLKKLVAPEGFNIGQKFLYEGKKYFIYRMRTEKFKLYWHAKEVSK